MLIKLYYAYKIYIEKKSHFQVDTSLPLFLQPARCSLDDEVEGKSPEFWQCAVVVVDMLACKEGMRWSNILSSEVGRIKMMLMIAFMVR